MSSVAGDREAALAAWERASARLAWERDYDVLHDPAGPGHGAWFLGGRLNLAVNALDRHLPRCADRVAVLWEGEPGDRRAITYAELHEEVAAFADVLGELGVEVGERVAIYMGLIPEALVAMLACARIGATHAVLPSVLPPDALTDRLQDLQPRILITQDGAWRHGIVLPLKARADEALTAVASVEHTVVARRTGIDVSWYEGDRWYDEVLAASRRGPTDHGGSPRYVDADQPALIIYVADRRGQPTGLIHRTAGLAVYSQTLHLDGFASDPDEVMWMPSEIGWLASETHGLLGPLLAGSTTVVYEGMLDTPSSDRAWRIIDRYGVNILLATPSVLRALQNSPTPIPNPDQVRTLRHVITAGEPTGEDTLRWLRKDVTHDDVVVSDAWGQTELGGAVTVTPGVPGDDRLPSAGLDIVDVEGDSVADGVVGDLVLRNPWPAVALGVLNSDDVPGSDSDRPGVYVTNDRALRHGAGSIRFLGRSDPLFSVSGQLVSATEVREVLLEHPFVADARVLSRPHPRKGRTVVACIVPAREVSPNRELADDLKEHVHRILGGLPEPETIIFLRNFPDAVDEERLHRALERLAREHTTIVHVTEEDLEAALEVG